MIHYDRGILGFGLVLQLRGSVFPRAFAVAAPCSLISLGLHVYFHREPGTVKALWPGGPAVALLSGFTSILAFLVVFRWSQAYNRWWEGLTLLMEIRGEWFNSFTSSLAFCNRSKEQKLAVKQFQHHLARLISLLYNCALQQVTSMEGLDFELISMHGFDASSVVFLEGAHDRVEIVFQWVQTLLVQSIETGVLQMAPPNLSRVYNSLGIGMTKVTNARKIVEFPIPFPYVQMMSAMLLIHSFFTTFICAVVVEGMWWCSFLTFIIIVSFCGISFIAIELEDPFGDDANDLPLHGMMCDMNDSLMQLLDDCAQTVPHFEYNSEIHDFGGKETIGDVHKSYSGQVIQRERARLSHWSGLEQAATRYTLVSQNMSGRTLCGQDMSARTLCGRSEGLGEKNREEAKAMHGLKASKGFRGIISAKDHDAKRHAKNRSTQSMGFALHTSPHAESDPGTASTERLHSLTVVASVAGKDAEPPLVPDEAVNKMPEHHGETYSGANFNFGGPRSGMGALHHPKLALCSKGEVEKIAATLYSRLLQIANAVDDVEEALAKTPSYSHVPADSHRGVSWRIPLTPQSNEQSSNDFCSNFQ